jgi:REP element-mobilizing transposase RayT
MDPLYTSANCTPAYELRWSLSVFATVTLPPSQQWLDELEQVVEKDGVRILEHRLQPPTHQFLLSTKPLIAPPQIVKSVKGRLQHFLRRSHSDVFRRNFSLTSVGDVRRQVVEAYVANQLGHHRMADDRVEQRLARFQLQFPEVDLSQAQFGSHGRYLYNLHLVLVHDGRWHDVCEERLKRTRDTVVKIAAKKGHRLSRAALLSDHLHLTLGGNLAESPETIALSYLNNLAHAHGMQPLFQFSYFAGTFGEYDLGAIRQAV